MQWMDLVANMTRQSIMIQYVIGYTLSHWRRLVCQWAMGAARYTLSYLLSTDDASSTEDDS